MFYSILEKLCFEINTTPTAFVTEVLKMGSSNVTRWKNGTSPNSDVAIKIANYFNVTLDYLLLGKQSSTATSKKDIVNYDNMTEYFDMLSDIYKERILERIETYLEIHESDEYNSYGVIAAETGETYRATYDNSKISVKHIPILGQTAAGSPIDIIEVGGGDYIAVPESVNADYALFVKGDSMSPVINDRDLLFIKSMPEVENGTIGVVDIDGTVTCKKIHRYNGKVELISLNRDYDPIVVDLSETPFRIIGKVMFCKNAGSNFFAV